MIINIIVVLGVILAAVVIVSYNSKRQVVPTKCGCGKTDDADGYCDGSHNKN